MIAEELAPLIAQSSALSDLGFHSGLVSAWDKESGSNTVDVAGTPLQDLPMLNLGDTVNIAVGDVVALLRFKSTMFIVGRIVLPGSEALATGAVLPETGTVSASAYEITTTETTMVIATLTAPPWSNAVSVFATLHATGRNDRGVQDYMRARVKINGSGGAQKLGQGDATSPGYANVSASFSGSGLLSAGTSFDIEGTVNADGGTWSTSVFNECDLTYSVMYLKV